MRMSQVYILAQTKFFMGRFFSRCRMDLLQSALYCNDPGTPPKYPQHVNSTHRKSLCPLEVENFGFSKKSVRSPNSCRFEKPSEKADLAMALVFRGAIFLDVVWA